MRTYRRLAFAEIVVAFFAMKKYWPALLMLVGIYIAAFGLSAMRYSRWDHSGNAHVHPAFHPWAIFLGLSMIVLAYWLRNHADQISQMLNAAFQAIWLC